MIHLIWKLYLQEMASRNKTIRGKNDQKAQRNKTKRKKWPPMLHIARWCEMIGSHKMFHKREGGEENVNDKCIHHTLIVAITTSKGL
jgi:hypothetical protein